MNPFDLKSALLAKHAQHVVLVHFPIALFLAGVGFDLAARGSKRAAFATAARLNLIAAGISVLPVLVTGILAWQWQLEGEKLKGILLLHLIAGITSGVLLATIAWLNWKRRTTSSYVLILELFGSAVIALTGHLGGFLSGVNGPG